MAVYNGMPYLRQAVESILAQTYRDFELVIVDDASTDDTPIVLAEYARRDLRIRILTHPANKGTAVSLAAGVEAARGALIARIDADDQYMPERLEKMVAFLDQNPAIGLVDTWSKVVDMEGHLLGEERWPTSPTAIRQGLALRNCMSGGVLMRKDAVLKAGNYRPGFRMAEDYDLWLRMVEISHIAIIPEYLCVYRRHPGAATVQHPRTCAASGSLARRFARERKQNGRDSHDLYLAQGKSPKATHTGADPDLGLYYCLLSRRAIARGDCSQGWHMAIRAIRSSPRCSFRALLLVFRIPFAKVGSLQFTSSLHGR
jgi:glycosyltransferase involved in cell wall biosynthesis